MRSLTATLSAMGTGFAAIGPNAYGTSSDGLWPILALANAARQSLKYTAFIGGRYPGTGRSAMNTYRGTPNIYLHISSISIGIHHVQFGVHREDPSTIQSSSE